MSDSHSFIDSKLIKAIEGVDEIWHAGDIGNIELLDTLKEYATVRAVYGNIDGGKLRVELEETIRFSVEDVDVLMTHIGGYPGNYSREIYPKIKIKSPTIFISGHSHILKVIYDKRHDLLHMNPGAIGRTGFHKIRTLLRFTLDSGNIKDLEVVELEKIRT